ncbi:unnamed protein product [Ixodes pacificus]
MQATMVFPTASPAFMFNTSMDEPSQKFAQFFGTDKIDYWSRVFYSATKQESVGLVKLASKLKRMPDCPRSILDEVLELSSWNPTGTLTLEEFLAIATLGKPRTVRERRAFRFFQVVASIFVNRIQHARVLRIAMIDYPLFLLPVAMYAIICIGQLVTLVYHSTWCCPNPAKATSYFRYDDKLIMSSERQVEIWRCFSYVLLQIDTFPMISNTVAHVLACMPFSAIHSAWKIPFIYFLGSLMTALTGFLSKSPFMVGASGAIYAVLWAHVADVVFNYGQFKNNVPRIVIVATFTAIDYYGALRWRSQHDIVALPHLAGIIAGITLGRDVLRNRAPTKRECRVIWVWCLSYLTFFIFCIVHGVFLDLGY